ncbi:MAG: glycosyltransferase [Nitrospirota bacterium]
MSLTNDKKRRILHTESSVAWGGQEKRILSEAVGLAMRGHNIIIAAQPESRIIVEAEKMGIYCIPLSMKRPDYPYAVINLMKIIRGHNIEILNCHSSTDSWIASFASFFSRRRVMFLRTRHVSTSISRGLLSSLLYRYFPDKIITTGESIRRDMIDINRFSASDIISIPTGIDTDIYAPERYDGEKERINLGIKPDEVVIGMIAMFRSWKDHRTFFEVADILRQNEKDVKFLIVGGGSKEQESRIEGIITELGLEDNVIMTGITSRVPEMLSCCDITVLTSFSNEGVPQSIAQSLSMRVPVVATDVGSVRELVIDGKTGYLVPPKDIYAIYRSLIKLLHNQEMRRGMGKAGRHLVIEEFNIGLMLDRIERLYDSF